MRGLTQESRKLPFTYSNITSCAKAIERFGSINECIVSVESIAFTSWIVSIFKHSVKKSRVDYAGNIVCWGSKQEESQGKQYQRKELHFSYLWECECSAVIVLCGSEWWVRMWLYIGSVQWVLLGYSSKWVGWAWLNLQWQYTEFLVGFVVENSVVLSR